MFKPLSLPAALLAGLLVLGCSAETADTKPAPSPKPEQAAAKAAQPKAAAPAPKAKLSLTYFMING